MMFLRYGMGMFGAMMVIRLVVTAGAIFFGIRVFRKRNFKLARCHNSSVSTLEQLYVKGEISQEEYLEKRETLSKF